MPNTITIRKAFSSGDNAAAPRNRLASAGFAREDIAVDQVDQHFELLFIRPRSMRSGSAIPATVRVNAAGRATPGL